MTRSSEENLGAPESLGDVIAEILLIDGFEAPPLEQLSALILPPLSLGQLIIAHKQKQGQRPWPVAACVWAKVSPAIDARLASASDYLPPLTPEEWNSGDIVWIMAAMGEPGVVEPMLLELQHQTFGGRPVKLREIASGAAMRVRVLGAARH